MKEVRQKRWGNLILYLFLLIIAIFLWLHTIQVVTAYEEAKEPVFEPIPQTEEVNTEEDGELFARTHEVICNEFTYEEAQLLMGIAEAEAGNQGPDGMWLVMSVVLNRVKSPEFPDSIKAVIYQESQFYAKGIGKTEISPECHEALARIERGDVAPQIIAFERTTNKTLEKYFSSAFGYRDHQFYTLKK
jgi:N-acetylmuramoyl-L-alanine amidase